MSHRGNSMMGKWRCSLTLACLLALFGVTPLSAQEIYRSVDKNGNPVYSDHPLPGGERIELGQPNRLPPPRTGALEEQEKGQAKSEPQEERYTAIRITQPADDEAVRNNAGDVTITVATEPGLFHGHTIRLLMDGSAVAGESRNGLFELHNVDRGTHTLRARVIDEQQEVVIESAVVTFHLLRASAIKHN